MAAGWLFLSLGSYLVTSLSHLSSSSSSAAAAAALWKDLVVVKMSAEGNGGNANDPLSCLDNKVSGFSWPVFPAMGNFFIGIWLSRFPFRNLRSFL
jgi:hypothetical protein